MYSLAGMAGLDAAAAPAAGAAQLCCRLGSTCWALERTSKPPRPVSHELLPGDEAPPSLAHRLLGPGSSGGGAWVLDGAAFVAAAEQLPAAHLRASLENCLLECTSTRLAQLSEQPSLSTTKVNTGTAALVQLVMGAGSGGAQPPALFPTAAGLPSLAELLAAAVLPPSATSRLLPQPVVQLFAAHCAAGVGRRSAAEQYDMGSMPNLFDRARSHARAAACRGGTFYTLLSGPPLWQCFHVQPRASGSGGSGVAGAAAAGKAAGKKQPRQKRKQEAVAADSAAAAAAAAPPASRLQAQPLAGRRPPLEPGTLVHSACSCCQPDLGVLWCSHRHDAMHALLSDPALHVLDCDALEGLLAPLSQRQLAQLLLTVAFACGTLPDVLLSLQLSTGRQSSLFLPRLGSLSLAVPTALELRLCCHTPADATQAAYYGPGEPYMNTQRDAAATCSNPLAPAHTASRLSVLSGAEGSAVQAVDKRVRPLGAELCWHLKGMGVDALDGYPESLSTANAAGIWPVDVRAGATLGFEDALGLTRALSLLGGSYTPIAQQLLQDLTVTVAHPHYCTAALPATAQPAFVRRLVALWKQLTTPAERWSLFMQGGMRLPSVWSSVALELAWEVVGQFATVWAMFRQTVVMARCTPRAAAMALLTRSTLLPRGGAAAGASAMTDLLLFERSMRRGFLDHVQGLVAFLKPRLDSLRPPREGSLLQLAARSYGRQLMKGKLAQAHAAYQELILDLQEAVLAESARFIISVCEREMAAPPPAPGTPEAAHPSDLRSAGPSLKGHTIGVLNTGHSFNANGLQRHALPAHLPPALTSSPFSWVTLDVGAMLADPAKEPDAPAWVCAYLTLAPKYSPAGAVPLWAWLRAGGMLGRLLSTATSSVLRRDWHTAAMLCDAAHKYLCSSISLAAAGASSEQQQLTALRPMLRTLTLAAAGQMRQFLALHRGGAVLTHTGSLRACCLLLRSVLSLTAELLDPALLQLPAAAAHAAVGALAAEIQEFEADAPPGGLPPQFQPGLAQIHLQQAMLEQVVAAHQHMQQAVQQAAHAEGLVPPPLPGLSPAAAAAAAVAGGGAGAGTAHQLALPAAEALAQDARMLVLVAQVVMDLASATIDAPALLPLASGSATAATSAVARRAMHDTALWRAAEVSSELGQYPYEHNPLQDETHPRSFLLNDLALLLAQQLPVALLPLQQAAPRTAAAAAVAAGPSGSKQQQQQAGQPQAAQPSGGPETRSGAQRSQEAARQASPAAGASAALAARQSLAGWQENALLGVLPQLDQLMGRLLDNFDGPPKSRVDSAVGSIRYRFKSTAFLSLAVTLLRLAASSGDKGPRQLAALPNAWKLLCSYVMDVAASSPSSSFHLRLCALAPPTLLCMLQACTVEGGEGQGAAAAAPAANAAAAGKEEGEEEEEEEPPAKRRRRSVRQRGCDPARSGRHSSAGGRSSQAGGAPPSAAGDEAAAGTSAAAAAAAVPAPVCQPGPARICVGDKTLEIATVQRAVQRVLNWLSTGVQEHWRGSSYTQWRPHAAAAVPPQQQQQQQQQGGGPGGAPAAPAAGGAGAVPGQVGPAAAAAAAAAGPPAAGQQQGGQPPPGVALNMNDAAQALAEAAMNGAAAFDMLAAANLEEQMMAAEADAADFGLPPHMLPPLHLPLHLPPHLPPHMAPHFPPNMHGVAAAAVAAGLAGMAGALGVAGGEPPRPRRAFEPRSRTSAMAAALTSGWPVSAVGVLHWWLRHRTLLQAAEFVAGPAGSEAAAAEAEEDERAAAAAAMVNGQPDSRSRSFYTLDGPVVRLAQPNEPAPKLGLLCGTLLSLLCMECAPEVHTTAAAALQGAAQQPATAQALAECGSFWALSRLLMREDLPADLKALGGQVVGGVKDTLLAQSGDWAAVFSTQQAAAADAEELAAERRARAAEAVAARAADAPGGGPVMPPPPHWFVQMGLFPGHLPPMMMGDEFDDEFEDGGSDEEDEEDDMSEDEEGEPFMDEDDFGGLMAGGHGAFFF